MTPDQFLERVFEILAGRGEVLQKYTAIEETLRDAGLLKPGMDAAAQRLEARRAAQLAALKPAPERPGVFTTYDARPPVARAPVAEPSAAPSADRSAAVDAVLDDLEAALEGDDA